jgi:glutathione synthase/RimK-type ligase-like ATP-grasp enzyme
MQSYDVVLLTDSRFVDPVLPNWYAQQILDDDALLILALEKHGMRVTRVDWADVHFDWECTRSAVFRTTWDYFHRFHDFSVWLDKVSAKTHLINGPSLIRWNWDKHYLQDLESKGIRIPETIFIERGDKVTLAELHLATGWDDTILKPAISGGGRHTYRLNQATMTLHEQVFHDLLENEAMLLQPFQSNILTKGELSLIVIDGVYSHAIIKRAKEGDYRVQDDFGGNAHPHDANTHEIAFAEHVVSVCDPKPVYARVDMIWDNDGLPSVSELELIEPELWLRYHPPAAVALADAIAKVMNRI